MFLGDPSTTSPTVINAVLLGMAHPACLEDADILGEKSLFSPLPVSYLTSFTNSLEEAVPGRIFQSCKAGKHLQHNRIKKLGNVAANEMGKIL